MRAVFSLLTAHLRIERGPMLIATLAVCLARGVFPSVHFVTDFLGAEISDRLGWHFDSVDKSLEYIPATPAWAAGKLHAYAAQTEAFLHLDFDVLLLRTEIYPSLHRPIIVQSEDFADLYTGREAMRIRNALSLPPATPYNCGVFGGTDIQAIHEYATQAIALLDSLPPDANGTLASVMVEQFHLGAFSERECAPVSTLLPMCASHADCEPVGYCHLWGGAKRDKRWIARAETRLARDFPEAYRRFLRGWPALTSAALA